MKPNFALDLSHDGIGLLHRGADGWHSVGNVSLDDPEFSEKLGFLRQTAAALESSGVTTKLVIPNSQIRFITAEAPGPTDAERNEQVRDALVGTTPYPIDELAYDWTESDGAVLVAAVARETLDEAESFAVEHGFNPVSFVATPNPGTFSTAEPFFGASAASETLLESGVKVEPDVKAVRVLGPAAIAATETPAADPTPDPHATLALEVDAVIAAEAVLELDVIPEPETTPEPAPEDTTESELEITPEPEADAVFEEGMDKSDSDAPRDEMAHEPVPDEAPTPDEDLTLAGVTAAELPDLDDQLPAPPAPAFSTRRATKDAATEEEDGQALQRIENIESRLAILPEGRASRTPKLAGVSRGSEKPAPEPIERTPPPPVAKSPPQTQTKPQAKSQAKSQAKPAKTPRNNAKVIPPSIAAVPLSLPESATPTAYPETETEEQAMTVFGARKKPAQSGKPRYLGLSLMVALLAILGGVVLWSTFFLNDTTTDRRDEQTENPTLATGTNAVSDAVAMLTEPSIQREADAGEVLAPAPLEAAEIAPVAELQEPEPQTQPLISANTPLTPQAAQTAYEDTGIWQLAPRAPGPLREDEINSLYITSVDPQIASQDAIALPEFSGSIRDTALEVQGSPAAHSAAFVLDERGLVIPSVDGTLTPDGVMVFAGAPPVKPGVRGNRVPQVVVVPDLTVAGFRPKPRPTDLVQQTETAQETEQLGGYTRAQLASLRPKPRPYELRPPQNEEPPATEEPVVAEVPEALPDAVPEVVPEGPVSALAVVLSSAPKHRPRGFAKLVERSRAAAPTERATAATAVPRNQTVQPSAPSRASVARLATTKNAINLRRTSLIGVYGSPSKRRALVRLSNGRYVKVKVGERVDGGKVAAIGQSELRYIKGGRTVILRMPKS